jgi:ADP-ribose pyrophosphatase YjhB (NUDIX family)
MKPGWGRRHPALAEVLRTASPAATHVSAWADGTLPLRASAYTSLVELPEELVVSVRCLVQVDDKLVVCTNADGISHPWPGGRREPGETFEETACREVREETGWLLDQRSLQPLGWLHLEHLTRPPEDWPFPHPDFIHIVFAGRAHGREGGRANRWSDTEGYELSSCLLPAHEAKDRAEEDPLARVFIDLLG